MNIFQRRQEQIDRTTTASNPGGAAAGSAGSSVRVTAQRLWEVGRGVIGRALDGSTEDFLMDVDQEVGQ